MVIGCMTVVSRCTYYLLVGASTLVGQSLLYVAAATNILAGVQEISFFYTEL